METSPVLGQPVLNSLEKRIFANAPTSKRVATGVKKPGRGRPGFSTSQGNTQEQLASWPHHSDLSSADSKVQKVELVTAKDGPTRGLRKTSH